MKRWIVQAGLLLALGAFAAAQDTTPPSGTQQSPNEPTAVRPTKKTHTGNKAKSAPGDVGRGGKAAGHDVKTGHPVEAGKSIGEGTGRAGKDVGKGTASVATEGTHRTTDSSKDVGGGAKEGAKDVGHGAKTGAKKVGHGVKKGVGKVTGTDKKKPETTTPPPQI
jgi:hypothetical protein